MIIERGVLQYQPDRGIFSSFYQVKLQQATVYKPPVIGWWVLVGSQEPIFFRCSSDHQAQKWIDKCVLNGATFRL